MLEMYNDAIDNYFYSMPTYKSLFISVINYDLKIGQYQGR